MKIMNMKMVKIMKIMEMEMYCVKSYLVEAPGVYPRNGIFP